jgi:vacuolar protein sorting-associated protein 54
MMQVFNSRMCQLVLGAGAMQVSGLRSITAKHLALSSQCLSAYMALHPLLKPLLTATLPTPRLGLLLPEFDRLLQVCPPPCSFAVTWF